MSSRKVFTVSVEKPGEPIEFDIQFSFADGSGTETESFTALPRNAAPTNAVLLTGGIWRLNAEGTQVTDSAGVGRYMAQVLVPESAARFAALLDDNRRIVALTDLGEILGWLVGEYAARPTTPSPAS